MNKRFTYVLFALVAALALVLAACGPQPTEAPPEPEPMPEPTEAPPEPEPTEPPMAAVGSEEHPIKVMFVPSTDTGVIFSGGEIIADPRN